MRVLHVISSLDPDAGGPPMIAFRLAAAQSLAGHDVHLASHPAPGGEARIAESIGRVPGAGNVKLDSVPRRRWSGFLRASWDELAPLVEKSDVVHLHGVWDPILRGAAAQAHRSGKPCFILLNGMLDPWSMSQKRIKKRLALAMGYRRMLDGAAALHLGNRDEQELLAPLKLKAPTVIIPNGVFLEELSPLPPPGTFRSVHPELRDDPYILFLSRLHYKKGLDYLADAFALLARSHSGVRLVVAGPDGGARADFVQRVRSAGLSDRVHIVGALYGNAKYAAMVDAACFCLPSRQEGFSLAITEALACGTPVVISRNCHFPEVAEAGAGRVVNLESPMVAQALKEIVTILATREQMSQAARKLIAERYTWPRIAEQTIAMYGEALRGSLTSYCSPSASPG